MKSEKLLDAIGMVGEDLISEARSPQKKAVHWKRWTALAACLALLITVLSIVKPFQPGQPDIIGPGILQTNPNTIPTTSPSDPSIQTDPTVPHDPTEPPYNTGPIRQMSASPETGYIGSAPYNPSSSSAFPNFLYSNATTKAVEILPDTYTFYHTWGPSGFKLVKMQLIHDIMDSGYPKYFYLRINADNLIDLTQYDALVIQHVDQDTIEKKVLHNESIGAAELMELCIFNCGDIYGYNDGLLAYDFRNDEHSEAKATLQEMEEYLVDHCFWCDEEPRLVSYNDLSAKLCHSAISYTSAFDNGIFAPYTFYDCGKLEFSHNTVRRYINGIATTEVVDLCADSDEDYIIKGEAFTQADLETLPDVVTAIRAIEESFQNGDITPPHIVGYEDMDLRKHGVNGWYFKVDGKVYAAIQVNFTYLMELPSQLIGNLYYDDAYFIMEAGSDEYRPITRDELLELQGTNDFIYTGQYDDQGKVPPDVYY